MSKLTPEAVKQIMDNAPKKYNQQAAPDISHLDVSLDDVDSFGDKDSLKEMFTDISKYNKMLSEKITFINDSLTAAIPFTRENLYLIAAYTGSGKSTIAANITFPLWKQGKKTLVLTNEESKQDVLFRIACLELGYNFNDYKKGSMPINIQSEIVKRFPEISQHVKVLDVNYKDGLTTKLEGVKNALLAVKDADYSCALIDYYQLIQYSALDKTRSRYDVLNDFRIWLGQYIKNSNVPIVVFAQLHSIGKRQNKDLDSRIKECPAILEPSTVVLEAIPNFDDQTTEFIIHKDRFGMQGNRILCGFNKGRYVNMTEEFKQSIIQRKLDKIATEVEGKYDQYQKVPDLQGREEE
jgi:replicative DNA helicase